MVFLVYKLSSAVDCKYLIYKAHLEGHNFKQITEHQTTYLLLEDSVCNDCRHQVKANN